MLTFAHILLGAAIGKYFQNLWLVIPIAFLSHYVLDLIPHYKMPKIESFQNNGLKGINIKELAIKSAEPLIGIILTFYLAFYYSEYTLPMIIGAFFAWLPDFFVFIDWKYESRFARFIHNRFSKTHKHTTFAKGIIPQIVVAIVAVIWIIF